MTPAKYKVPTVAELFSENMAEAFKHEELNLLLNQEPKADWIKQHPYIKGHLYLPIDKVEYLLKKIFKRYSIEITGQGTAFNGVWVTVRVHFLNPATGEMQYHDGIGACQLQVKSGTSPADLANINNGAISMAFPIAKTLAVKDACDHFGKLFGADLNRKDTIPFEADARLQPKPERDRMATLIKDCTSITELQQLGKRYAKEIEQFELGDLFDVTLNELR